MQESTEIQEDDEQWEQDDQERLEIVCGVGRRRQEGHELDVSGCETVVERREQVVFLLFGMEVFELINFKTFHQRRLELVCRGVDKF